MEAAIDTPTMPFGKFKGKPLAEIGSGYLCGMCNDVWLWPDTRSQFLHELARRGLPFGRFKNWPLNKLPTTYLKWLSTNVDLLPPYDILVNNELKQRTPNVLTT